jgi:single-strand DNA-binding protein
MSSVNRVTLIGNLGADPEVRYTNGGTSVCSLRIATTETWNDKEGVKQERTEWHSVSVWGKQAEHCGQYLTKGRQVYVEGRLQTREYTDKEGIERKVWEIQADRVNFLGGGSGEGAGAGGGGQRGGGQGGGGQGGGGNRNHGGSGGRGGAGGGPGGGWGGGGGNGQQGGGQGGGNRGGGAGGGGSGSGGGGFDGDPIPFSPLPDIG